MIIDSVNGGNRKKSPSSAAASSSFLGDGCTRGGAILAIQPSGEEKRDPGKEVVSNIVPRVLFLSKDVT